MDKYEYKLKLEELRELVSLKQYRDAALIADEINWNKVRNVSTLCTVGKLYENLKRYEDARDIFALAYDRSPVSKTALLHLTNLSIRLGRVHDAEDFYEEFVQCAPRDRVRYEMAYEIAKMKNASLTERIAILENFKEKEYTEEWALELAKLYHEAGLDDECVATCDELFIWFGEGDCVRQALELKAEITPLSELQQQKLPALQEQSKLMWEEEQRRREEERLEAERWELERLERERQEALRKEQEKEEERRLAAEEGREVGDRDVDRAFPEKHAKWEGSLFTEKKESAKDYDAESGGKEFVGAAVSKVKGFFKNMSNMQMRAEDEFLEDDEDEFLSAMEAATRGDAAQAEAKPQEELEDGEPVPDGKPVEEAILEQALSEVDIETQGAGKDMQAASVQATAEQSAAQSVSAEAMERLEPVEAEAPADATTVMPVEEVAEEVRSEKKGTFRDKLAAVKEKAVSAAEAVAQRAADHESDFEEDDFIEEDLTDGEPIEEALNEWDRTKKDLEETIDSVSSTEDLNERRTQAAKEMKDIMARLQQLQAILAPEEGVQAAEAFSGQDRAVSEPVAETVQQAGYEAQDAVMQQPSAAQVLTEVTAEEVSEAKREVALAAERAVQAIERARAAEEAAKAAAEKAEAAAAKAEAAAVAFGAASEMPPEAAEAVEEAAVAEEVQGAVEEAPAEDVQEAEEGAAAAEEAQDAVEEAAAEEVQGAVEEAPAEDVQKATEAVEEAAAEEVQEAAGTVEEAAEEMPEEEIMPMEEIMPEEEILPEEEIFPEEEAAATETEAAEKVSPAEAEAVAEDVVPAEGAAPEEVEAPAESAGEAEGETASEVPAEENAPEADPAAGTPLAEELHDYRPLTEEQKENFTYFVSVPGMARQISKAVEGAAAKTAGAVNSATGNMIVQGPEGIGKTVLATNLIKAVQSENGKEKSKIGKISAASLNKRDFSSLLKKVSGGYLIVEKAGELTAETVADMSSVMEGETGGLVMVLEDTPEGIRKVMEANPAFAEKFTEIVTVPEFSVDDLVAFGKAYAYEMECEIDEMGVLALHSRIQNIQRIDHVTMLAEVKDIVDEAIEQAESQSRKLFGRRNKRYTEDDYLILLEEDFAR